MQVTNPMGQPLSLTPSVSDNVSEKGSEVGKDSFLKLLIAQLEHQDPMSPMENIEFTAQLAQFNTLEQIQNMNTNLSALLHAQDTVRGLQAAELIGKKIQASGTAVKVEQGNTSEMHFRLSDDSAKVRVDIFDEGGNLVHMIEKTDLTAGEQSVTWDGRNSLGSSVREGDYQFSVTAVDNSGNSIPVDTFVQGTVDGVEFVDAQPFLKVNGSRVEFSSLVNVTQED